jgi:hypothetical protein
MNPSLFTNYSGPLLALASAALFGASTPVAKLLLGVTAMFHLTFPTARGRVSVVKEIGHATRPFSRAFP